MTGIIDYGAGNLRSVENALDFIGEKHITSSDVSALDTCDRLILPGVGAFPDAIKKLCDCSLDGYIKSCKKPLLGICLGMQLLFTKSYEFGEHFGLGLIDGEVIKLTKGEKIPHMGWNSLEIMPSQPLMKGIENGAYVYFVHSYKCVPSDRVDIAATTFYGEEITASVHRGNIYGMQYHPEKSSESVGLKMLKNFTSLYGECERI